MAKLSPPSSWCLKSSFGRLPKNTDVWFSKGVTMATINNKVATQMPVLEKWMEENKLKFKETMGEWCLQCLHWECKVVAYAAHFGGVIWSSQGAHKTILSYSGVDPEHYTWSCDIYENIVEGLFTWVQPHLSKSSKDANKHRDNNNSQLPLSEAITETFDE